MFSGRYDHETKSEGNRMSIAESRNNHERLLAALGPAWELKQEDFMWANEDTRVGFSLSGIKKLIPLVTSMYSKERPKFEQDEDKMSEYQRGQMKDDFFEKWVHGKNSFVKSTDLVDLDNSAWLAREAYKAQGYDCVPKIYTICDSPVSCGMVYRICDSREVLEYLGCGHLWSLKDDGSFFKETSEYFDLLKRHNEERENNRLKSKFVSPSCEPEMYNRVLRSAIETIMVAANGKVDRQKLEDAVLLGPIGLLSHQFDSLGKIKATMYDGCEGDKSWWMDKYCSEVRYKQDDIDWVRRAIQNAINLQAYGNCDSECAAYWDWHMQMGCEHAEKYFALIGMAMCSGWWHASSITCHFQNRPWSIGFNNQMQALHKVNGPSLAYRDGYTYWSIDGIRCDDQLVMRPETQTVDQVENEQNADLKTIRISRFAGVDDKGEGKAGEGWAKYVRVSEMKPVHQWDNPLTTLPEALFANPKDDSVQVLMASCPTGRPFGIPVPKVDANGKKIATCEDAQQWVKPRPELNLIART
jgi:hypothetical protein